MDKMNNYKPKTEGGKRLIALASFLEKKVPKKRFDFDRVVGPGGSARRCGTSACAMGWAPSVPLLRKAGLRRDYAGRLRTLNTTGAHYLSIACWLFDIKFEEANFLFTPGLPDAENTYTLLPSDAGPRDVASRIRNFVRVKGI